MSGGVPARLLAWFPWAADVNGTLTPYTDSMGMFTLEEDCNARPALGPDPMDNPVAQVAAVVAPLGNINACPLPPSELGEDRAANRRAVMPPSTTYRASGR